MESGTMLEYWSRGAPIFSFPFEFIDEFNDEKISTCKMLKQENGKYCPADPISIARDKFLHWFDSILVIAKFTNYANAALWIIVVRCNDSNISFELELWAESPRSLSRRRIFILHSVPLYTPKKYCPFALSFAASLIARRITFALYDYACLLFFVKEAGSLGVNSRFTIGCSTHTGPD